ncbi:alpha-hydroxy acid oxidase [Aspergillus alliaceus]|uniref:alpha-hydroxy acid oxidase n=1 Tax=Petromyces alliaceus TaxID=209559 RepID=UPI0012A51CA7|nr:FMN-dependent dehydrogenase [Aspergillus alliaceus]KAB8237505.1 FMN-dependent dehydrogenase [Aspergillus alliaceus]
MEDPITIAEVEALAQKRLPRAVYDYYACGADDQHALRRNVDKFSEITVLPRVLCDVTTIDTSTEIFGCRTPLPIAFAPSAMQKLAGGEGELHVARAAAKMALPMTLSTQSTMSLEDVADTARATVGDGVPAPPLWFQMYMTPDAVRNESLIQRAEAAGYEALVLTVDTPILGNRLNERKTPLVLPPHLRYGNFETKRPNRPTLNRELMDARTALQADAILKAARKDMHDASLTWDVLPALRRMTRLRIIMKGIMAPTDARKAVEYGADAIVVSNHGGRQLDCVPSTIEVLPSISEAVQGKIPVIVDGGIRRGSDVFKAIALGADLVMIGRPILWGLSYKGQEGVETVVNILERELYRTMALAGVTNTRDIRNCTLFSRSGISLAKL